MHQLLCEIHPSAVAAQHLSTNLSQLIGIAKDSSHVILSSQKCSEMGHLNYLPQFLLQFKSCTMFLKLCDSRNPVSKWRSAGKKKNSWFVTKKSIFHCPIPFLMNETIQKPMGTCFIDSFTSHSNPLPRFPPIRQTAQRSRCTELQEKPMTPQLFCWKSSETKHSQ